MIRINLLPYRNKLRQKQILFHVVCFLIVVAVVVVLCIGINIFGNMQLQTLLDTQKELAVENKQLDKKIGELNKLGGKRDEVQGRLAIVDELQVGRFRSLNILYEVSRIIPKNVWITSLSDGDREITVTGSAGSSEGVSDFMRALNDSEYFQPDSIKLGAVSRKLEKKVPVRSFSLKASFAKIENEKGAKK